MTQETETTEEQVERTEQSERPAAPRFSESESPPAWLIATRGDLRELEFRVNSRIDDAKADTRTRIDDVKTEVNTRIDDAKTEINTRIDDVKSELSTRIDDAKTEVNKRIDDSKADTRSRFDEMKEEGRARDAVLSAHTDALARIEEKVDSGNRNKQNRAVWIGIGVGALGIIVGIIMRLLA